MSFVNTRYTPYILAFILFYSLILFLANRKYFTWIKTYWFYDRTFLSRLSTGIYIGSFTLMLFSLLDLRGPEERIKSNLPDQKTIIVLDSSSSMLAEDVRPSRFGKAIQMARHLVKSAAAHQISIVLFSDIQKRLIPFTDDIDLLDSRLAALEKNNSVSGGSNISQAIAEAINYFDGGDNKDQVTGNIIVFTDAEESEGEFDLEVGPNINLAIVGIGTVSGGNIPLRWEDGSFRGYKTQKGQPVITKLDEDYIKKIGRKVKNYKYWIANSYSLPTDEILNFFRGSYNKKQSKGHMRVRPVYSHLILIPAIFLYGLSVIIGRFKTFQTLLSIILLVSCFSLNQASSQEGTEEKKAKEIPPLIIKDLNKMKEGKFSKKEILKVAEKFLKKDDTERATEIYNEYSNGKVDESVTFNRATSYLKGGKLDEAMPYIQDLYQNSKNENLKDKLRNNVLMALNGKSGGKGQSKDDKNKDKKDNSDKDQKDQDGKQDKKDEKSNKDGKPENQKGNSQQDKNKDKDKDKEGKNSKDNKSSQGNENKQDKNDNEENNKDGKDGKDPKDLEKPERPDNSPKSLEEKEKKVEQQRKMVKTPAMIKQILSDDRELQKRMMDTSTNERSGQKPKRDW